jgi:1-deoxy-D-xylulose-5-phosphate reductoisomerase
MVIAADTGRKITILGVTGSIGRSTQEVILESEEAFSLEVVTGGKNVTALAQAAKTLKAQCAVIAEDHLYTDLKHALSGTNIEVKAGKDALIEAASRKVDWVMAGISGAVALEPTMAAVKTGAKVALANKECLVCAGDLIKQAAQQSNATLLPADSEHNAIFQLLDQKHTDYILRIILTASGGPFRNFSKEQLATVTLQQALQHPNWSMGAKITIDSATMMNKGLEVIEAYHLFPVRKDQIDVIIHPQSVVHGVVEYQDGSTLAQLGHPDMRTPISITLGWPNRIPITHSALKLTQLNQLTFEHVDYERFPALKLAYNALHAGGSAPLVLNTANEVAVQSFIGQQLDFLGITQVVAAMLEKLDYAAPKTIQEALLLITEVEAKTLEYIEKNYHKHYRMTGMC